MTRKEEKDAKPKRKGTRIRGDLTEKEYQFARAYALGLKGKFKPGNALQSALHAFDTKDDHTAQSIGSEYLSKPIVIAEIKRWQALIDYDAEDCLEEINGAIELAISRKQVSGLVSAIQLKAKIKGLIVDKAENRNINEDRTVKTLDSQAEEVLAELSVSSSGVIEKSEQEQAAVTA